MSAEALSLNPPVSLQSSSRDMLSPAQKAAVILTALPPDAAGDLLQQLGDEHVRAYVDATRTLRSIPHVLLEGIIVEFIDSLDGGDFNLSPDSAKEILLKIMSPDAVSEVIGEASGIERTVWDRLNGVDDDKIADFVMCEHPRTSAIIVSMLSTEKAAEVIARLDVDSAENVIGLLKEMSEVDPVILDAIADTVKAELLDRVNADTTAPDEVIGAIFDNLTDRTRDPLMKRLEDKTPEFAKAVAKHMFLFDDIPDRIEARDVPILTRAVNQKVLENAIAFARSRGSEAAEFIMEKMSRRLAEQLEESIEEMAELSESDGEKAEADFIKELRRQVAEGLITLKMRAD